MGEKAVPSCAAQGPALLDAVGAVGCQSAPTYTSVHSVLRRKTNWPLSS